MSRHFRAALGFAAVLAGLIAAVAGAKTEQTPPIPDRVLWVRLDGTVGPVMAEALDHALDRAEREHYRALVVEVDTPGGLESSMREIVKRMLAAEVPTITWVGPSGGRAASAGVFITMAGDVAAMAPGTNIGAATPVQMQGAMDSTMARKVTNDASAFARTVAAQRGRNAKWAEDAVRHAVSASETEAVDLEVVDFIAPSLTELLAKSDGRIWRRGDLKRPLEVLGLPVDRIEASIRQRLLGVLADPNISYILLMLGFYGLLFELQNPGAILPGIVGAICLILAFFSFSVLTVNYAGVALIVLAIVFFLAEVKVASHGLLGAGGVLALVIGSLFLFQGETARISISLIIGVTLATALFFGFVVGSGLRAQKQRVRAGKESMIGARGVVIERLAPDGWVRLGDERWSARSDETVEVGREVEITGIDRLTLQVRPAKEART